MIVTKVRYAQFVRASSSEGGGDAVISTVVSVDIVLEVLVDRRFCRVWRMWPLAVAIDFGRYFFTSLEVNPGQVTK